VPMLTSDAPRFGSALDLGYGHTESQEAEGAHHRFLGSMGFGWVPSRGFELGLLESFRYDRHPNDGQGIDTGTIGQTSLLGRYSLGVGSSLRVGADLGATFPGSERVGDSLTSPAVDVRALASWTPASGLRYAGFVGYRLDRTSGVGNSADRYRQGDRLALGLSDFNAVVLGLGAIVPLRRVELLAEVAADLLVGANAPSVSISPIRIDLGMRAALSSQLQAEFLAECSPSARPSIGIGAPLIPIEPRLTLMLGLRYQIWHVAPVPKQTIAPAKVEPQEPVVETKHEIVEVPPAIVNKGKLVVDVFDTAGNPLSDAVVTLTTRMGTQAIEFSSGSTFSASELPEGRAHLVVQAALMRNWDQDVEISNATPAQLRVSMVTADASAQIRGLVRAFDGHGLAAHIHIDPLGYDTLADGSGAFNVDVAPGQYRIKVWVDGYVPQSRSVNVGKNGVIVINVDLQKGRP
jgi:hypothetical protein